MIKTIEFKGKQLHRSKYRGFTNTTDSSSAEISFGTVRLLDIPISRCFLVFLKFLVFILTTDTIFSTMTPTFVERETNFSSECRAVTTAGGSVSPGYFHRKQIKNRIKRTSTSTIPLLLIPYTRHLEILATALRRWQKFVSPEDNIKVEVSISWKEHSQIYSSLNLTTAFNHKNNHRFMCRYSHFMTKSGSISTSNALIFKKTKSTLL